MRLVFLVMLAAGCVPAWQDDPALVTGPRIVAIRADPPEVAPGSAVSLTAVVASPQGPSAPDLSWTFCTTVRPLSENGPVAPDCVRTTDSSFAPAAIINLNVPAEACRLFGPETPPRMGDQPPARPRDPDPTGGYYQPIRATGAGSLAFGAVRILCNLASAPLEAALELRRSYQPNRNPQLIELTAQVDGRSIPLDALPPDREIDLVARWDAAAAETYLAFDPATQSVRVRRESLRVSWLVTAGAIVQAQTGRAEEDRETTVITTWRSPSNPPAGAEIHLWAVLRDSRGGVSAEHRVLRLFPEKLHGW